MITDRNPRPRRGLAILQHLHRLAPIGNKVSIDRLAAMEEFRIEDNALRSPTQNELMSDHPQSGGKDGSLAQR